MLFRSTKSESASEKPASAPSIPFQCHDHTFPRRAFAQTSATLDLGITRRQKDSGCFRVGGIKPECNDVDHCPHGCCEWNSQQYVEPAE